MNKRILSTLAFATMAAISAFAQPSSVKKVDKSLFTLTTYGKDGTVKSASTHGVFVGDSGEGISLWTPFVGAERATVTDTKGNTMEVVSIMGANELYDVCRFKVKGNTTGARIAENAAQSESKLWLADNSDSKTKFTQHAVEKVETFMDKYSYYLFAATNTPQAQGLPFVNDKGEIVGLLQNANGTAGIHAVDPRFITSLKIDGLAINSPVFKQTSVRLEMPADKDQALIMLMMSQEQKDSLEHSRYIDDFIERFPNDVDGYSMKSLNLVNAGKYADADAVMSTAVDKATDKAEAHAEYSRVIYQKMVFDTDTTFTQWSLEKALEEVRKACDINSRPAYKHREAQIIFAMGDYAKAYDMFMSLTKEDFNHQELYFEAAQCKNQMNAKPEEIITLLDSAVAACPKPLTSISAPYILARGQVLDNIGEHRKALADYNTYDTLMLGRADASFYYTRYKCEVQIKQYQQALNDIAHAAFVNPGEPMYIAELASLQLRLNQIDDAIKTTDLCIKAVPGYADPYIIKGIALIQKDNKKEAMECFEKAKELGDERAQGLIDKYK